MFITPERPRGDMVSLRDNVFTFAAADFAPWLLQLNQINTALFLHQQRLHDMSLNQMSPKTGWAQPAPKQAIPHHGLPMYGSGYFSETQNPGESMSLMTGAGHHSLTGNRTSRSAISSLSHYCTSAEPRSLFFDANVTAPPDPLDSSYWQTVPHPSALPPFAHGGDPFWDHSLPSVSSSFEYNQYTLDVHHSAFPQTAFRPGEAFHNLSLPPMLESDTSNCSKWYASSGMLEAMALDDPHQSLWDVSPGVRGEYEDSSCTKMEPEKVDNNTVSPKLLRICQTPTPSTSCESLHTNFLSDGHLRESPDVIDPLPSVEVPLPSAMPKPRKPLPDAPNQSYRSHPAPVANTPNRESPTDSDFTPPASRRSARQLQPKARYVEPSPSPSPSSSSSSSPGPVPGQPLEQEPLPSHLRAPPRTIPEELVTLKDRTARDDFLVKQKQQGLTYKEIRRLGGFIEAESTLRGRYRTLTKSREERVRKPEWSEKDLRLLEEAVLTLAPPSRTRTNPSLTTTASRSHRRHQTHHHNHHHHHHHHHQTQQTHHTHQMQTHPHHRPITSAKVPWKKVADHITLHGGSYHFGNSTCRKRWDELVWEREREWERERGRERGNRIKERLGVEVRERERERERECERERERVRERVGEREREREGGGERSGEKMRVEERERPGRPFWAAVGAIDVDEDED